MKSKPSDCVGMYMHLCFKVSIRIEDLDSSIRQTKNNLLVPEDGSGRSNGVTLPGFEMFTSRDAEDSSIPSSAARNHKISTAIDGKRLHLINTPHISIRNIFLLDIELLDIFRGRPVLWHRTFPTRLGQSNHVSQSSLHHDEGSSYFSCVASIFCTIWSGSCCPANSCPSICIASPPLTLILLNAALASSRSFVRTSICLLAPSNSYSAVLSSCRVCASCCRRL